MGTKDLIRIDQLPPELQKKIRDHAAFSIHVDREKENIKAEQVDIEKHITRWISLQRSPHTKDAYRREINRFINFLDLQGIHPALCSAENVDDYIIYLGKEYGNNSIRQKVSICSSFYSLLERYKIIQSNPFRGSKLPRRKYKKAGSPIMNEEELKIIITEFVRLSGMKGDQASVKNQKNSAKRILPAISFMREYGLRVGSLRSTEIKDGYFTVIEKGKKYRSINLKKLHHYTAGEKPFSGPGYEPGTIKHAVKRVTKRLHAAGKIRHPYTCHDFRHYFAARLYEKTRDVLQVKEALGHSSLAITDTYLQGLGIV